MIRKIFFALPRNFKYKEKIVGSWSSKFYFEQFRFIRVPTKTILRKIDTFLKHVWCYERTVLQRRNLGNISINFALHESVPGSQVLPSSVYFLKNSWGCGERKRIKRGAKVLLLDNIYFSVFFPMLNYLLKDATRLS